MPYYTSYDISWESVDPTSRLQGISGLAPFEKKDEEILKTLNDISGIAKRSDNYVAVLGEPWVTVSAHRCEWQKESDDMYELSKRYPDVEFYVVGVGDARGDTWEERWLNGCREIHHVEMPSFTGEKEPYTPEYKIENWC